MISFPWRILMDVFSEYLGFDMNYVDDDIKQCITDSKSEGTTRKNDLWEKKLNRFIEDSAIIAHSI